MANTLRLSRDGAVGFIDWLDHRRSSSDFGKLRRFSGRDSDVLRNRNVYLFLLKSEAPANANVVAATKLGIDQRLVGIRAAAANRTQLVIDDTPALPLA